MKLLILGGTGRTGCLVVKEALARGYDIHVLLRNKHKHSFNSKLISVFEGLPTKQDDLAAAMLGCHAIISALNISRTSDFPWAKLRTPNNLLSESMENIIAVAQLQSINRIIAISAWGVYETKKELPFWFKWLIDHSNISPAYIEHEAQEELLKSSDLNWTAVRPTILTNSKKDKPVAVSYDKFPKPGLFISRQGVAQFIVSIIHNQMYYNKRPTISEL
ncbi:NAD(P)-dependent oxidoreductase [Mucilaginibacter lappiensis]|uniref:NAD(P)-dependent oxidoreductase n=1 Tax=Mucilaginibacter lappiensis TaxID=354630 RepID=UPI003D1B8E88